MRSRANARPVPLILHASSKSSPTWTVLALGLAVAACRAPAPAEAPGYRPRAREFTVTTAPLLVKEAQSLYPFLRADFARGGVLEGKEVYAFSPSVLVAVAGDTIHFRFVNPEDDEHAFFLHECTDTSGDSFILPDCQVRLPGQSTKTAVHVARHAGLYTISCSVAKHLPMMWGQLVVLSPAAVVGTRGDGDTMGAAPPRVGR